MKLSSLAQYYTDYPMHDRMHDEGAWLGAIWFLILVAIVVGAVILITKSSNNKEATTDKKPLDIAKERYARGEITKDQFTEIKKELKS